MFPRSKVAKTIVITYKSEYFLLKKSFFSFTIHLFIATQSGLQLIKPIYTCSFFCKNALFVSLAIKIIQLIQDLALRIKNN